MGTHNIHTHAHIHFWHRYWEKKRNGLHLGMGAEGGRLVGCFCLDFVASRHGNEVHRYDTEFRNMHVLQKQVRWQRLMTGDVFVSCNFIEEDVGTSAALIDRSMSSWYL